MEQQFSTELINSKERFDYWHELVYRTYAPCSGHVQSVPHFNASLKTVDFGKAEVSKVTSTGIRYDRSGYDVLSGPRDDLFLSLLLSGEGRFEQNGRNLAYKAGDILLYDAGRPYTYCYEQSYSAVLMRIPRPLASARGLDVERLGGVVLSGETPVSRLIGSLFHEASALGASPDTETTRSLSAPILDTIATAVCRATGDDATLSSGKRSKIEQIKRYLHENMADSSLTLDKIARDQNVSVRTLCRLFSQTNATPIGWLQTRRLEAAYAAIAERKVCSITNAAFDFGFNDLSHFDKSFKKRFGVTPSSLLRNGK